jgi:hydrogenase expression/formation protein HypC
MCLAIPMPVLRAEGAVAWCRDRDGGEVQVDTLLSGPLEAGQWVLVFLGAARDVVGAEDAQRILAAIGALEAIQAGDMTSVDAAFADLINRPPTLPDFLRESP